MKRHRFIYLLFFLTYLNKEVKSQSSDTVFIRAKVESVDTIDYYVVIKAISKKDSRRITILSPLDERNEFIAKYKDSDTVNAGCSFDFILKTTNRIKNSEGSYFFISLRKFDYGGKPFLEAGELPYLALNMYRFQIYY